MAENMDYCDLVDLYESLDRVSSKLGKTRILAEFLRETSTLDLEKVVLFVQGKVFPKFSSYELGIAARMMIKAISKFTGFPSREIEDRFREKGDLGLVAEEYVEKRKQVIPSAGRLTIDRVFGDLRKLAFISGAGSQNRKFVLIGKLLASAKPKEARFIVKTILEELRVGVAEGIIRDAIVKAFLLRKEKSKEERKKLRDLVDYAWNITSDYGEVARISKEEGADGLGISGYV